jgi:hypothetical protein
VLVRCGYLDEQFESVVSCKPTRRSVLRWIGKLLSSFGHDLKSYLNQRAIIFSAATLGFAVFRLPKIVNDLKEGGDAINEKLQSTLKQLRELQRIMADERPVEEITTPDTSARSNKENNDSEKKLGKH